MASEKELYDQYLKEMYEAEIAGAAPTQAPMPMAEPDLIDKAQEYGMKGLEMAGRALDYPGGIARTTVQGLTDIPYKIRTGQTVGEYPEDIYRALQGQAPTSEELLARQGAEPGIARTATGLAKDIALDPTTYMTFGAAAIPKVQKAYQSAKLPLSKGAEKAGEAIYKSGLKRLDIEGAKYGKEPVSELLMKEGVTGSYESISKQMDDLANKYTIERDAVLKKATEQGGVVPMADAMAPLQSKINEIKATKDPNLQAVAETMQTDLNKYLALDKPADLTTATQKQFVTPEQASGYKSSSYNQLPSSAYSEASRTPVGKELTKTKAYGLKEATEKAVEKASGKNAATQLKDMNEKLGRLLTSKDKATQEAGKEIMKNAATSVDAPLAVFDWRAALAKKAADAAKMTGPRTVTGKALKDAGQSGLIEPMLLGPVTPWLRMQNQPDSY